jgi:TolB-like protein/DNA-binding winged helix-turn-helix (wHTH) protein
LLLYDFSGFRLDAQRARLFAMPSGEPVALTAKCVQLLLQLIENRGDVVAREDLLQAVWPHVIVEDNNLERHISMLRRALGEAAGENRFIATVPGRGYRFVAPVSVLDASPSAAPATDGAAPLARAPLRRVAIALGVVLLIATIVAVALVRGPFTSNELESKYAASGLNAPSLAVLPLANLTGDSSNDYLGEGIAEELIYRLTRSSGLKVPARSSTFAYQHHREDARRIANDLSVSHVLDGSVRRADDRVRVTVQLIDAANAEQVWSQSFERRFDDVFVLQDDIAGAIVSRLTPGAHAAGTTGLDQAAPSKSTEAYRSFLQANALVGMSERNLRAAMELYDDALARDPSFARALVGRANTHLALVGLGLASIQGVDLAEDDIRRALALDRQLADAHVAMGTIHMVRGRWVESRRAFELGRQLDPLAPATNYHVLMLESAGHAREARELIALGRRLAPLALAPIMQQASSESMLGRYDESLRLLDMGIGLGAPMDVGGAPLIQAQGLAASGRYADAARTVLRSMPAAAREAQAEPVLAAVYEAYHVPSKRPAAAIALRELVARVPVASLDRRHGTLLMVLHAMVDDTDSALRAANQALDYYEREGMYGIVWSSLWSRYMTNVRRDAGFRAFVARLRLPEYWAVYGPPQDCRRTETAAIDCG